LTQSIILSLPCHDTHREANAIADLIPDCENRKKELGDGVFHSSPVYPRCNAMMLFEPSRTEFDLSWRMFGIRVRVHPMFWLVAAIFGWSYMRVGIAAFLLFVVCFFVSILVHELGHVFMGRLFGRESHIVLYGFGGLAISNQVLPHRGQRIAVMFAGPLAGFLLFGAAWLFEQEALPQIDPLKEYPLLWLAAAFFFWMNLVWNILNLIPIWPLDGGQISREICTWLFWRKGLQISLGISFVLAGLLAIQAVSVAMGHPLIPFFNFGSVYSAILFALLAVESFQLLQQSREPPWREDWPSRWDQDRHRDDWRRSE
jgi:Zn-dependent protease